MVFKKERKLLSIIKSQHPKLPNSFYDYNDIYPLSGLSEVEYLSALRNLQKEGCISFGNSQKTTFRLESNGIYFKEFLFYKALEYIADKAIDFLALIVSLIALVLSLTL